MNQAAKILIYGAGVIGCLYGALLVEGGEDVTVLARGHRLAALRTDGLRYDKKEQSGISPFYRQVMNCIISRGSSGG